MQTKNHLFHLDVLKGIAILMVVLTHMFSFGLGVYNHILPKSFEAVRMPIFMLIAGYFAARPWPFGWSGQRAFWRKQAIRMLLPLLIIPLCYAHWMGYSFTELYLESKHLGYWFTWALFEMFVYLYLFRWMNARLNRHSRLWVELGIVAVSVPLFYLLDMGLAKLPKVYEIMSVGELSHLYLYFALGYCLARLPKVERFLWRDEVSVSALLITVCLLTLGINQYGWIMRSIPLTLFSLMAFYGITARMSDPKGKMSRLWAHLGRESRGIYLLHFFLLPKAPQLRDFFKSIKPHSRALLWELSYALIGSAIIIVLCLGLVRLIKSSPILHMLLLGKEHPSLLRKSPREQIPSHNHESNL